MSHNTADNWQTREDYSNPLTTMADNGSHRIGYWRYLLSHKTACDGFVCSVRPLDGLTPAMSYLFGMRHVSTVISLFLVSESIRHGKELINSYCFIDYDWFVSFNNWLFAAFVSANLLLLRIEDGNILLANHKLLAIVAIGIVLSSRTSGENISSFTTLGTRKTTHSTPNS